MSCALLALLAGCGEDASSAESGPEVGEQRALGEARAMLEERRPAEEDASAPPPATPTSTPAAR